MIKNPWVTFSLFFLLATFIPNVHKLLNSEMYLKMLVQIPAYSILSFIIGLKLRSLNNKVILQISKHGSSALIFLFGSQTFWMIPRSLDLSVYNEAFAILLPLNLIGAGFLFGIAFKSAPFVLKTAFSIYGLAMFLAMGIIYINFNSLICAVFSIEMQHLAGKYILYVFPFVFVLFLYRLFYNMSKLTEEIIIQ